MSRNRWVACTALMLCCGWVPSATAGGIDHKVTFDDSGIWNRNIQQALEYGSIAVVLGGAAWEGGETRLGRTFWQAVDSSVLGAVTSEAAKHIFTRARPTQTDDPNQWFQGSGHYSFPSGEVTLVSAAISPFVFEYAHDHPWTLALEALPLYDGIARVKVQAHWQTDVLAGFAIGTAAGYYAHSRDNPFFLEVLPHGVGIGIRKQW
ncbi:MAG TPA: phosphatase PAP2 family protein [Casimicrobiaceae bacterium]